MSDDPVSDALARLHEQVEALDSHEGRVRRVHEQVEAWRKGQNKLARAQRDVLREAVKAGLPWQELADIMHVSRQRVQQITGIRTRGNGRKS